MIADGIHKLVPHLLVGLLPSVPWAIAKVGLEDGLVNTALPADQ